MQTMVERVAARLLKADNGLLEGFVTLSNSEACSGDEYLDHDQVALLLARAAIEAVRTQMALAWERAKTAAEGDAYAEHEFAWVFLREDIDAALSSEAQPA